MLTWEEKLAILEEDRIELFLSVRDCGCGAGCIQKIARKQGAGVSMVLNLREARLAGKCTICHDTYANIQHNCQKISNASYC